MNALAARCGRSRSVFGSGVFFELCRDVPELLSPVVPLPLPRQP
ncbi:hypothetical protein ACIBFB_04810 [Nocardiopsis sp. NPDC050513]